MGHPSIPLSVISKAAELQFHYTVDKVLLGNRWLRKATRIQPKFPYMVDSFERRYVICCFPPFETALNVELSAFQVFPFLLGSKSSFSCINEQVFTIVVVLPQNT